MALVVTVAGVNRTAALINNSISISQIAEGHVYTAELALYDASSNIEITAGSHDAADEITIVDGATNYFSGFTANQDIALVEGGARHLKLQCHGYGSRLGEINVEYAEYDEDDDMDDKDIILDLFNTYVGGINAAVKVILIEDPLIISFTEMNIAEILDAICERTKGRWYVDNDEFLHYFLAEVGNDAGFDLSDEPNDVTSFAYFNYAEKHVDGSTIVNQVRVVGAEGIPLHPVNDAASQALYGIRAAIVTDNSLVTLEQMQNRADAIITKWKDPQITYTVRTYKAGASAGDSIDFKCDALGYDSISNGDDPLVIRELRIFWSHGTPVYEMTLGTRAPTFLVHSEKKGMRDWDDIIRLPNILTVGGTFFDATDGLLLLNPPVSVTQPEPRSHPSSANYLHGKRGERVRIGVNAASSDDRGSINLVTGRWPGTKALVFEIAETNDNVNPLMYDGDSDNEADDWTTFDDCTGSPSWTVVDHPDEKRGWLQRVQYTGVAGDANENILFYYRTAAASYAEADPCTFSADYKGSVSGCVAAIRIIAESNVNASLGTVTLNLTLRSNIQRAQVVYGSLPANTDHVRVQLMFNANIDNGDTLDVYIGAVNVEKNNHGTTLIHGNAGEGYSWAGVEHDSIAARTKSYLLLDDLVDLISANNTLSFRFVVQAPYDHDAEWPGGDWAQSIMDARDSGNTANTYLTVRYNENVNRFTVTLGANNVVLYPAEFAFSKGDWLDIWVTLDYTEDEYYMYVDGKEVDRATDSEASQTLDSWNLGSSYLEGNQCGWAFAEFAVFGKIVTPQEIAQPYNLQRPLVDMGALEKPMHTILDGGFRFLSSMTGERIEITPSEIAGYDGSDVLQFELRASDGKAKAGAGVVTLDAGGIGIEVTTAHSDTRAYKFELAGTVVSYLSGFVSADDNWLRLKADDIAAKRTNLHILSVAPSTYAAEIELEAQSAGTAVSLVLHADSDATPDGYGTLSGAGYFNFVACDVTLTGGDLNVVGTIDASGIADFADRVYGASFSTDNGTNRWGLGPHIGAIPGAIKGTISLEINGTTYYIAERHQS